MIKKLLLSLGVIFFCAGVAYSQATFKGTVKDNAGDPVAYGNVLLKQEGRVLNGGMTDAKGEYQIFGVSAGTYDLEFAGPVDCPNKVSQTGIAIGASDVKFINFKVSCATDLEAVTVRYEPPVFESTKTTQSVRMTGDEVRKTPGRSITGALANLEGVTSVDGSISSVRGNRADGQQMIIDGVRVRGNSGVSMQSVEEAEMIQGGIPAEYGDGTSFTVITTKGVSKDFHGSVELRGSLDGYNNFLLAASVSGPILKGKGKNDPARIGFMVTGEASYNQDSRPLRGGSWRATQETVDNLIKNPIRYDAVNFLANSSNASYLEADAFEKKRVRNDAENWSYLVQAKLDFLLGKTNNIRLSMSGSYEYLNAKNWGRASSLFNSHNNPVSINSTMRLSARLNHRVYTNTSDSSLLKNVMYDINVNYTNFNGVTQDPRHKDNFFKYGHIGKFKTERKESYSFTNYTAPDGTIHEDYWVLENIYVDKVTFDGTNTSNPDLVNYTQNFVDRITPEMVDSYYGVKTPYDENIYRQFGALMNGDAPSSVYGLYSLPGTYSASYSKNQLTSIGANANLSMNIGNHELKLGYQFEKLTQRGYTASPTQLWTLMRNATNTHFDQLNTESPVFKTGDTIFFNQLIDLDAQTTFDRNLRTALGLDPNGDTWIDIDNLDPSTYDLEMFSPEELLVGISNSMVTYYGYDYTGKKKYKKKTSIEDFFEGKDANGNKTYNIGAYEPVYMAMYIQDKFSIQSLLFNVGVRVDRFDANQEVLKDPYLFRPAYTISDVKRIAEDNGNALSGNAKEFIKGVVSNASDDWNIYVSQKDKTLSDKEEISILGYRNGSTWYDVNGQEVQDAEKMLGVGGPLLESAPEADAISKVSAGAFEKYAAKWSVMPRVSFSFPVSDNSLFTAHYNIMTIRPTNLQINPIDYLFIEKFGSNSSNVVNNPNLKPYKSIDYEIGFTQKIGEKSALAITAYYSEKRDQIQTYRYTGAYPSTYYSYNNIDFGTVQGFTFNYTLRRTKNVALRASYTIQFAKGTGSSSTSNLAIIQSGQPNLRTLTNLEFDQRHRLSANIDYRFDGGTQYNGPVTRKEKDGKVKTINWLANTGVTLIFSAASGLPYSRSSTPYSTYVSGTASQLSGSINGSHKPWTFQCDLRIDKTFMMNLNKNKKDKEGNQKNAKPAYLMVYLDVQNLFNFKNILTVYTYTGNADDDGYLSATEYTQQINAQLYVPSYINYYQMTVQNPYNYSYPTRVSLGLQFGF